MPSRFRRPLFRAIPERFAVMKVDDIRLNGQQRAQRERFKVFTGNAVRVYNIDVE